MEAGKNLVVPRIAIVGVDTHINVTGWLSGEAGQTVHQPGVKPPPPQVPAPWRSAPRSACHNTSFWSMLVNHLRRAPGRLETGRSLVGSEVDHQGRFLQRSELLTMSLPGRKRPARRELHPPATKGQKDCASKESYPNMRTCRSESCRSKKTSCSKGDGSVGASMQGRQ